MLKLYAYRRTERTIFINAFHRREQHCNLHCKGPVARKWYYFRSFSFLNTIPKSNIIEFTRDVAVTVHSSQSFPGNVAESVTSTTGGMCLPALSCLPLQHAKLPCHEDVGHLSDLCLNMGEHCFPLLAAMWSKPRRISNCWSYLELFWRPVRWPRVLKVGWHYPRCTVAHAPCTANLREHIVESLLCQKLKIQFVSKPTLYSVEFFKTLYP